MFCTNCGKKLDSTMKVCPQCGAPAPEAPKIAAPVKPPEGTTSAPKITVPMGTPKIAPPKLAAPGLYRRIVMAFGAMQVLIFFLFSYGSQEKLPSILQAACKFLDIDVPKRLTALNAIRLMKGFDEFGVPNADQAYAEMLLVFVVPLVSGVLIALICLLMKKGGMVLCAVLSALSLFLFYAMNMDIQAFKELGYELNSAGTLVLVLTAIQTAVCVIAFIGEKKAAKKQAARDCTAG